MATCTEFIQPLNLKCLLVNTFAGSTEIFTFIAFIAIASMAAYFRMSGTLLLISLGLFITIAVGILNIQAIFAVAVVLMALIVYNILAKLMK